MSTSSVPITETVYAGPPIPPAPVKAGEASAVDLAIVEAGVRRFLVRVFAGIVAALVISALFAAYLEQYRASLTSSPALQILYLLIGGLVVAAGVISRHVEKMPPSVAAATLVAYSAIQGALLGFTYRSVYSESLAPVYLGIAIVFAVMWLYGLITEVDLASVRSLLIGSSIALAVALGMSTQLDVSLIAAIAIFVVSSLMLALVGHHRDFLRDLPGSFDDDPRSRKAAAVGALQIYLDLIVIVVVIIEARWFTSMIEDEVREEAQKFKL